MSINQAESSSSFFKPTENTKIAVWGSKEWIPWGDISNEFSKIKWPGLTAFFFPAVSSRIRIFILPIPSSLLSAFYIAGPFSTAISLSVKYLQAKNKRRIIYNSVTLSDGVKLCLSKGSPCILHIVYQAPRKETFIVLEIKLFFHVCTLLLCSKSLSCKTAHAPVLWHWGEG